MERVFREARWFWATLMLSSATIVAVVFATWELVENRLFRDLDYVTLHALYMTRGIASSLLLALWAAWYVLRQRRWSEAELRRSWEHYRGLLEASPGAVALYDASLLVTEWNATAERLYGFSKEQVLRRPLPTVPPEKEAELGELRRRAEAGVPVLDLETLRRDSKGAVFEVQLSLLPFHEQGANCFLEVTADIRERVRLRQTLLEVEKLTSMGQMAAGTAHHLNTPLAALLLRVQMMRERVEDLPFDADLEHLENGLLFCQQFVRRLLEFSRRPAAQKQPEAIAHTLESVLSFLAPAILAKRARVSLDAGPTQGSLVLADRNLLEALFSILLANALDAISDGGTIAVDCTQPSPERVDIRIADDGCGVSADALPHVFEPFFTTKRPGKGTGLGLPIARNIVIEHGGSIRLDNGPMRGAVAVIELPVWHQASSREEARP